MVQAMVTAGQAAARAGLTRKALRVYEAKGLLAQPERTAAGYRLYTADDIAVLTFIRQARTLGLHLDDIAEILTIHRRGTSPCAAVLDLIDTRVAEITAAIADLRALRRALILARAGGDCPCPTEQVCAIVEHPRDTPTSPGTDSPPPTHTAEDHWSGNGFREHGTGP